jgi:hypothetical protein
VRELRDSGVNNRGIVARYVHGSVIELNGIVHLRYRAMPRLKAEWTRCGIEYTVSPGVVQWVQTADRGFPVPMMRKTKKSPSCIGCVLLHRRST